MKSRDEQRLDLAIDGKEPTDDSELTPLIDLASELEGALAVESRPPGRDRAMFVQGVAGRKARGLPLLRFAVPAFALCVSLLFLGLLSRSATPSDPLFPAREVLERVGLAPDPVAEVDRRIEAARAHLLSAEDAPGAGVGRRLALRAIFDLGLARRVLDELEASDRGPRASEIELLESRAVALILTAETPANEDGPGGDSGPEDSSGPGSGDDSGPGDSSGPGSGDDSGGEDNSGSGGGEDNSGSGGGEDNSGSGGGEDNSGSGSEGGEDGSGSEGGDDGSGSEGGED